MLCQCILPSSWINKTEVLATTEEIFQYASLSSIFLLFSYPTQKRCKNASITIIILLSFSVECISASSIAIFLTARIRQCITFATQNDQTYYKQQNIKHNNGKKKYINRLAYLHQFTLWLWVTDMYSNTHFATESILLYH